MMCRISLTSISQIWWQHIRYSVFNGIAFLAGLAGELSGYYLLLVFLEYLKSQVAFTEWTGQDVKKIAFHVSIIFF